VKFTMRKKVDISIIIPAYNEDKIIENNLREVDEYMAKNLKDYTWEIVVVNDGSKDETAERIDSYAKTNDRVVPVHHPVNLKLGQALRTGFNHSNGDYVVVLDVDLSYTPDHIERMLKTIISTKAQVVVASPYMEGGKVSNVPLMRKFFSKWANRFLGFFTPHINLHTITGMVRSYQGKFIRSMNLKAMDIDINSEIIYKTMLLRGRIIEIPAHLDWGLQKCYSKGRVSSFKIFKGIISYFLAGFIFRPFMFFILPGFLILFLSLYPLTWAFIHTYVQYTTLSPDIHFIGSRLSGAIARAFSQSPHTFVVAGFALLISIQLISLGLIALQNKKYYEELFHLGSSNLKLLYEEELFSLKD
jgi:glycosyltransferase involved in cell wall biosynthesis